MKKQFNRKPSITKKWAIATVSALTLASCMHLGFGHKSTLVKASTPVELEYSLSGNSTKKLVVDLYNPKNYASLSVMAGDKILVDNLNIPKSGDQIVSALVEFEELGDVVLILKANDADISINSLRFEDFDSASLPKYTDISEKAGIDKVSSIKYGGPSIADIDNDGDYDFIVNNHNAESSKLYWNNGDGTVTKHSKNLARWFMHDLHGTALGDYDNDGDLDLVLTMGGGNGKNPSRANFYHNNGGEFVLMTGDVGINKGGRGRGTKWSDMDLDGDLDLLLFNESSLSKAKPQQFFYENLGDGNFEFKDVDGIQDIETSRVLITDLNNDNIDDILFFGPLSVWQGNGDFTFTEITSQIPEDITSLHNIMGIADLDIDNDGDLDLYLATGKPFEHGKGETPSLDMDEVTKEMSIKPRGYAGVDKFDFSADGAIKFHNYYYLRQGAFRDQDYPIFLGEEKHATVLDSGDEMVIEPAKADGWPDDISENGVYFGHIGGGKWKAALVRGGNIFWGFKFSLSGVNNVQPEFEPQNRNEPDILLRNDGGSFVDVSKDWNIPQGTNSLGVTVGDFNNDSHQDVFVYRWGLIGGRISDLLLLNDGQGNFETVTMHGANDVGGPGNGDMGQAFDFDLDGDLDLLNGSEGGEWYLYSNNSSEKGNFALVKVGYSPEANVDPISAEIILKTADNEYKRRVGSAGAIFSQSLLNIAHFGLGTEEEIESIHVRWRNGETVEITDKPVNALFDTDKLDPTELVLASGASTVREGASMTLIATIEPDNADKSLSWSSSNEDVLSVSEAGVVTALGQVGEEAIITASSDANNLSDTAAISIVEWRENPLQTLSLSKTTDVLLEGETVALQVEASPLDADDASIVWTSSDLDVASVSETGLVTALSAGDVVITATSSSDDSIKDQVELSIEPFIEPYIKFVNRDEFENKDLVVGQDIEIEVEYNAGSGNTVIASDEGGVRFWLRHFKNKWIPVKDIILTEESALKTSSGRLSMTISLEGMTPTVDLPEEQFYQLRTSFTASDGSNHDASILPLSIVAAED